MLNELAKQFSTQIQTFFYLIMLINGLLHFIFAGAVARDAGSLYRLGQKPVLVSAPYLGICDSNWRSHNGNHILASSSFHINQTHYERNSL